MNEQSQQNDFSPPAPEELDVAALVKKMQQQLVLLEKKIDILISQSEAAPRGEKHFSKPFRPFNKHPSRRFEGGHDNSSGEKRFFPGRRFEKRPAGENREFGRPQKAYDNPRERDSASQGHHFKKSYGGKKKGFEQKGKPFYLKRKDRG
jgi:hypothetical protein